LDIDKIQRLIEVMVKNDLVEVSLRDGEVEINLRRPNPASGGCAPPSAAAPTQPVATVPLSTTIATTSNANAVDEDRGDFIEIKSPMVGTFYAGPEPEAPPFITAGTKVIPSTVVCLLEAMKVFSEIKAEVTGTIERIFVKNAESVEYGQPLFLVRVV